MANKLFSSILGLLAVMALLPGEASAETFEFLTFTPPSGWTNQVSPERTVYQRKSGIGMIAFYASSPATGSESEEFAKMWRTRISPTLPGETPQPEIQREGEYVVAMGNRVVNASEGVTTISLVAIKGRGRVLGVLTMATGNEVIGEITAFLDSIKIGAKTTTTTEPNPGSVSTGGIAFDYQIPPGLMAKNDGQMILLTPAKLDDNKCAYWLSPPRPSKGSLEADARAATLEIPIQGRIFNPDRYNAMRGTTPDGWKYSLFGTSIQNSAGTTIAYAMALAFPAGAGQVNIVLGVGNGSSNCYMFDPNFARLFYSLNPRSWTSDGGKTFARELMGFWRSTSGGAFSNSDNFLLSQYKFLTNGRYDSGRGSITTTGHLETTTAVASDGSYKLSGNGLTLTSDTSRDVSKFRVRVYEDYSAGRWWRKMALFSEEMKIEREYERIEN